MGKRVHLKERLSAIAEYVENSKITADVGCDHGRLSVSLLQTGRSEYVYASDVSIPSLRKARLLCDKCGLSDKMEIREADGLRAIPSQPDTIIIAGMGGMLIADILSASPDTAHGAEHIIMQPMRGIAELRTYLYNNGYEIIRDRLCKEAGRIYQIIDAHYAGGAIINTVNEDCPEISFYMLRHRDPLLPEYLNRLQKETDDALECSVRGGRDNPKLSRTLEALRIITENYYGGLYNED